jgi:papain like protease
VTTTVVDLRPHLSLARDQGTRPTCLAFAMSDGHMSTRGDKELLSVDYLHYHAARRLQVGMNAAVTAEAMVNALKEDGQPYEADCPYDEKRGDAWNAPTGLLAVWRRTTIVRRGPASTTLAAALSLQKASILGLGITPAFYAPDPTSARIVDDGGAGIVGHAVLVVGMDASSGSPEFLIRNSWGITWGKEGHAWLSAAYVDRTAIVVIDFQGALA